MDIRQAINKLLNDQNISKYQISKSTGISQVSLNKFAKGESDIDNMPLGNALKLYDYYLKNKEDIEMTNDKRDILFGRLLGVCNILGERLFEKGKPAIDEKTFKRFPNHPASTFTKMHKNIMQYAYKFGEEESYLLSLFDKIIGEMDPADYNDAPLDKYLLGFYKQQNELENLRK